MGVAMEPRAGLVTQPQALAAPLATVTATIAAITLKAGFAAKCLATGEAVTH